MDQISTMDKKFFIRGPPQVCKSNQDITKADNAKKRNSQGARKKDLERSEKASSNRGRSGQRYVRTREKMGGQLNLQHEAAASIHTTDNKYQCNFFKEQTYSEKRICNRQKKQYVIPSLTEKSKKRSYTYGQHRKESYLQANCQFVVSSGNDYSLYENDPDCLLEWDLIEEVWLHCLQPPNCPICLFPPVAAQITKCGHIFCYSCMLHYLALTDSCWRTCPICSERIEKDNLKSVSTIESKEGYNIGDEVEMVLMQRNRKSLTPTAVNSCESPEIYSYLSKGLNNCKLIKAATDEIGKYIIERERNELELQKAREGDQPEACFIDEAFILLEQRIKKLLEDPYHISEHLKNLSFCPGAMGYQSFSEYDSMYEYNSESCQASRNGAKEIYYFYQAKNRSHVYLYSLNVQMLMKEFGNFENCPLTITGTIVEKDSMWMTAEYRERFRYLKHLPLSCSFGMVELTLTEPIFSPKTINIFKDQIDFRVCKRLQAEEQVEEIERRVRLEEDKLFGRSKTWNDVHLDSRTQFPEFSQDVKVTQYLKSPPREISPYNSEDPSIVSEEYIVQAAVETESDNKNWSKPSFAQKTKNEQKVNVPKPNWPSLPAPSSCNVAKTSNNQPNSRKVKPKWKNLFVMMGEENI